jgi:hypothetical protein
MIQCCRAAVFVQLYYRADGNILALDIANKQFGDIPRLGTVGPVYLRDDRILVAVHDKVCKPSPTESGLQG